MATQPPMQAVRAPMSRLLRTGLVGFAVALPVVALVGFLVDGGPGVWGAVLGLALPLAFFSITAVVALVTVRLRPEYLGAAVLGSWLLKIIVLIAVLVPLSHADFYNRVVFFVVLLLGTFGYLALEAVIVLRTKVPYVEPLR